MLYIKAALIAFLLTACTTQPPKQAVAAEEPDDPGACATACANRAKFCGVTEPECEPTCKRIEAAPGVRNWARCGARAMSQADLSACGAGCSQ